jgi:hypothetical protein
MSADFENKNIKTVKFLVYDLNKPNNSTFVFCASSLELLKFSADGYVANNPNANVNEFPCLTWITYDDGDYDFTLHKLHNVIGLISNEG